MQLFFKKAVIGLGVVGVFLVYSLGIRRHLPVLAKPSSLASTKTSTSRSNSSQSSSSTSGQQSSGSSSSNNTSQPTSSTYKDGTYTGSVADAYYGNVQVSVIISGGQITDVKFLQYPNTHATSVFINQQAMPYLKQEAIQAQNANVQIVSGATFTSQAFSQSFQAALAQARS